MTNAPEKKKESSRATRETILEVSTKLFARQGYDRVTMRDISSAVGVALPTIYHYFKDKENLYREVELYSYGSLKDRLIAVLKGKTNPETQLRAFIGELFDVLNEDPVFRNLALRNMLDPDERHHKFLVGVTLQKVYDALVKLLNEFRAGSGNQTIPLVIIGGIFGFIVMEPAKRQIKGYPYDRRSGNREREEFINHLVRLVATL